METQSYWCVEKVLSCDRWCVILFRQTKSPFSAFSWCHWWNWCCQKSICTSLRCKTEDDRDIAEDQYRFPAKSCVLSTHLILRLLIAPKLFIKGRNEANELWWSASDWSNSWSRRRLRWKRRRFFACWSLEHCCSRSTCSCWWGCFRTQRSSTKDEAIHRSTKWFHYCS